MKIRAAGLCHSDLSVIDGNRPRPVPIALSHEASGVVEAVGATVTRFSPGDHVVLVFVPSCGQCLPCAAGRPALRTRGGRGGLLTRIGLGTFIDPRQDGSRLNARTREELVELVTLGGEEWLWYKPFAIDVVLIRGTTADAHGNVSMEREALTLDNLAIATAAHNSGGIVIAQVERLADVETLSPRQVEVPGVLVDYVVVADAEDHKQTWATAYSPTFAGEVRVDLGDVEAMPLDAHKIIARRAALKPDFDTS
jgi:acyl CoA:acetate/3-ketoacid CoA transferase